MVHIFYLGQKIPKLTSAYSLNNVWYADAFKADGVFECREHHILPINL